MNDQPTPTAEDARLNAHAAMKNPGAFADWTDIQTRHVDVDMMGHVNHAVIATYFESGRDAVMGRLPKEPDSGFMLGDVHLRYLAEVNVPDTIRVGTTITRVGNSSFVIGQGLFIQSAAVPAQVCAATCLGTMIHVDRQSRKPASLPPAFRDVLKGLLSP